MPDSRLQDLRRAYAARESGHTTSDRAYAVYIAILILGLLGVPALRAVATLIADPPLARALTSPGAATAVGLIAGAALPLALVLGRVRGPLVMPPFIAAVLLGSDLPRRHVLRRQLVYGFMTVALLACSIVLLVTVPAGWSLGLPIPGILLNVGATLAFGLLLTTAWLYGQIGSEARITALTSGAIGLLGISALAPWAEWLTPWGWYAQTWSTRAGPNAEWVPVLLLGMTALASLLQLPRMLDRVRAEDVLRQAIHWESATLAGSTGDVQGALGTFRASATTGRGWNLVRGRSFLAASALTDLGGSFRTPSRAVICAFALVSSGYLFTLALTVPKPAHWLLAVVAVLAGYGGVGGFTDGLRHCVQALTGTRLYGVSDAALVVGHILAPFAVTLVLLAAGAAVALDVGTPITPAFIGVAALSCTLILIRLHDAAKGQLPPELTIPIPTPLGDMSGLSVLAWQLDAPLYAGMASVLLITALLAPNPAVPAIALVVLLAAVLWRWKKRVPLS